MLRNVYKISPEVEERVIKRYKEGIGTTNTAEMFNISKATVIKILRRHGLSPHKYHKKMREQNF